MLRNEINAQVFFYSTFVLVITELLTQVVASHLGLQSLLLLGAARIVEALSFLLIIAKWDGGLETLGLTGIRVRAGLRQGLIWSACFGAAAVVLSGFLFLFDFNLLEIFTSPQLASLSSYAQLLIVGGVIGPIAEEIFFRGIVYGYLRSWGVIPALLGSTVIFGLVHASVTGVTFIQIIGGLVFAVAYEMEKNLLVPITIHVLGNMAIFLLPLLLAL